MNNKKGNDAELEIGNPTLSPLAAVISSRIAEKIHNGELQPGAALPTERELSLTFQASRPVIKNAILDLVSRGLVHTKPRCKPVVAQRPERVLDRASSHIATWLWPTRGRPEIPTIHRGIRASLEYAKLSFHFHSPIGLTDEDRVREEHEFLQQVKDDETVAGLLIWYMGGEKNLQDLQGIRRNRVPIVFVDRLPPAGFEADFVGTENRGAARRAMKHLVELGHKRIAFITNGEDVSSAHDRFAGYKEILVTHNLPPDPQLVRGYNFEPNSAEREVDALLGLEDPPTAIFAINDMTALRVRDHLMRLSIRIPEDISLIGFDGMLQWAPFGGGLTTMVQNFELIGQVASELLVDRLDSDFHRPYRHVLLEAPLFRGGSTRSLFDKPGLVLA